VELQINMQSLNIIRQVYNILNFSYGQLAEGSACDYDFIIGTPETEVEFKKFAKYLKEKIPNVKRGEHC
jgi:hypothetical protein